MLLLPLLLAEWVWISVGSGRPGLGRYLAEAGLLWHSGELAVEERIARGVPREPLRAGTGRVDEGPRGSVVSRYAKLADVAEGVLAFARRQERVETGVMRIRWDGGLLWSLDWSSDG